jgi:flagellar biosynthesis chaperone FliJ
MMATLQTSDACDPSTRQLQEPIAVRRFRFPQEALRRVKQQECQQAEMKVWQARQRVRETEAQLERAMAQLERATEALRHEGICTDPYLWMRANGQLQSQIQADERELALRIQAWRQQVNILRHFESELHALESLRNRQWQDHLQAAHRMHQQALDETALRQWHYPGLSDHQGTDL